MMIALNRGPTLENLDKINLIIGVDQSFPACSAALTVWIGTKRLVHGGSFLVEFFGLAMRFHGTFNYTFVVACVKTRVGVKIGGLRSVNSPPSSRSALNS
jgi:hypothetical protein